MKKLLASMMCALIALVSSSCLQMHSTISLNKDGSGTVTESVSFGAQMLAMMAGFGGEEGANPLDAMIADAKKDAEERVGSLGEGVTLKEVKPIDKDGKKGVEIVYAFEDINKLRFVPGSSMNDGMGEGEGEEEAEKDEPMKFSYKDGVLVLDNSDDKEAKPEVEQPEEEVDMAGMAMAKQMLKDMRVTVSIEIPGGIEETNAKHVDGNTVTLVDMNMGALMEDEEKFKKMMAAQADTFAETKELLEGVEGCKIEPSEKLSIKLK